MFLTEYITPAADCAYSITSVFNDGGGGGGGGGVGVGWGWGTYMFRLFNFGVVRVI